MVLSSASELGKIIGGLVNTTNRIQEDHVPGGVDQAIVLTPIDRAKVETTVTVSKKYYDNDAFILDHPFYGVLDYDADLLGVWHFDGDFSEATHNVGDCTSTGTMAWSTGISTSSVRLDGTSDQIIFPSTLDAHINSSNDFTLALWLKYESGTISYNITWQFYALHGSNAQIFRMDSSQTTHWRIRVDTNTNANQALTGGDINDGEWHFAVVTYDSATSTITNYHDGALVGSRAILGTFTLEGGTDVRRRLEGNFVKHVDEPSVWSRKLTPTEISNLYNAGTGSFFPNKDYYCFELDGDYYWSEGLTFPITFDEVFTGGVSTVIHDIYTG